MEVQSISENYEKIADRITAQTAKKLEKEKGLILVGTGGGMMAFECVEEYVSAINANEKVCPYLHNYPFTYQGKVFYYMDNPKQYSLNLFMKKPMKKL